VYNSVSLQENKRLDPVFHDIGDMGNSDVVDDRTQHASSRWMDEGDGASCLEGGAKGRKARRRSTFCMYSGSTGIPSI
jgi:hypothetical protein